MYRKESMRKSCTLLKAARGVSPQPDHGRDDERRRRVGVPPLRRLRRQPVGRPGADGRCIEHGLYGSYVRNFNGGGSSGGSGSAGGAINVTVGGKKVQWTDAAPFIDQNNRTMVPPRAVADALGLEVGWNNVSREASFSDGTKTICFPINTRYYRTGPGEHDFGSMDTAAVIVNNRTYAPIRYLAEYFGYQVGWDVNTRTVTLTGGSAGGSAGGSTGGTGGGGQQSQLPADFSTHMYITSEWDGKTGGGNTNHPDAFVTVKGRQARAGVSASPIG